MKLPFLTLIQRISEHILAMVAALPLDAEEKTRLQHFLAFLLLGVPTMLVFGLYNCWQSNWVLGAVIFAMALSGVCTWTFLKQLRGGIWLYRINAGLFGGMLLFMAIIGGEADSKALWLFTFPLLAFFLLSTNEGLAWTLALFLGAVVVFWLPQLGLRTHRYHSQFIVRFVVVYLLISVLAFWFEHLRQHYRKGMELEQQRLRAERTALQEALSQVKQLSGMLPICASCKKVRDDQGYWTQIEAYISSHSHAEFSHGICPDCGDQLYPGIYRKSREPR